MLAKTVSGAVGEIASWAFPVQLAGWVLNDSLGVLCEVEGTRDHLDR